MTNRKINRKTPKYYSNLLINSIPFDHEPQNAKHVRCPKPIESVVAMSKIKSQLTIVPCATLVCPAVPCPAPVLRPSPLLHLHILCLYETCKTWMFNEKFIFHQTNKQTKKKNPTLKQKNQSIDARPWSENKICPTNHLIWLTTNYNLDAEPHQRFICLNHKPKQKYLLW